MALTSPPLPRLPGRYHWKLYRPPRASAWPRRTRKDVKGVDTWYGQALGFELFIFPCQHPQEP